MANPKSAKKQATPAKVGKKIGVSSKATPAKPVGKKIGVKQQRGIGAGKPVTRAGIKAPRARVVVKTKLVTKIVKPAKKKDEKRQESMKSNYHIIAWRRAAKEKGFLQKDGKDGFKKIPQRGTPEYNEIMVLKEKIYEEIVASDYVARENEEKRLKRLSAQLLETTSRMEMIKAL